MAILGLAGLLAAEEGGQEFSIFGAMLREWYLIMPLLAASIAIVVIAVERYLFVKKATEQAQALKKQIDQIAASGGKPQEIVNVAETAFSGGMYKALYEGPFHPQATAQAMERARTNDIAACKKGLWFVGSMGNLAPFFGLFGTVIGIIQAFMKIAETGGGGFAAVSQGISTALVTTAAGIFVGILAVFAFNYLNVFIGKLASILKNFSEEAYEARLIRVSRTRAAAPAARPAAPQGAAPA